MSFQPRAGIPKKKTGDRSSAAPVGIRFWILYPSYCFGNLVDLVGQRIQIPGVWGGLKIYQSGL